MDSKLIGSKINIRYNFVQWLKIMYYKSALCKLKELKSENKKNKYQENYY